MNNDEYNEQGINQNQNLQQQGIQRNPIMYHEQIDQLIVTPEGQTSFFVKKVPRMIKKPVYELDENSKPKIVLDENGEKVLDENGQISLKIKTFEIMQEGWTAKAEYVPVTELLTVDYSTSNCSYDACSQLARTGFMYNRFLTKQIKTNQDYSTYLHKLRNDNLVILSAFKSYNGGTIQAIKTFINKMDEKQWIRPLQEKEKVNPFGLFGGKPKEPEPKYTGFQT